MMPKASRSSDEGFALVMALIVISVISVIVAVVAQYAFTSEANSAATQTVDQQVYAADGQADGAVRAMATNPYLGIAPFNTPCFSSVEQLNGLAGASVSCQARSGSGAVLASALLNSQPAAAVTALGTTSGDGVTQAAGKSALVRGDITSANTFTQGAGATLTTEGSVTGAAAACSLAGTASPPIVCPATAPTDPAAGANGPSWSGPSAYPAFRTLSWVGSTTTPPTCPAATVVPIMAGTYTDSTLFQFLFNCSGKIIWFQPGIYYLQFPTASELVFNNTASVIVAGTGPGCTPSPCGPTQVPPLWTAPGNVTFPDGTTPTDKSACDQTQTGVELVMGGATRLTVTAGKVQLCSYLPSGNTTAQHIAVYGYPVDTTVGTATANATTFATVANPSPGNRGWTAPASAVVVDGVAATVKVPQKNDYSEYLEIGGFNTNSFPTTGTVPITATVTATASGTGEFHALLVYGPAGSPTLLTDTTLLTCPADPRCSSAGVMSTFNFVTSVPASALSTLRVRTYVFNYDQAPVSAFFDGLTLTAPTIFAATTAPVATPGYTASNAGTAALIKVNGAFPTANFSIHGTVYAPLAALDFNSTGVPYTMVDRGLVARHLDLSTTAVASVTPPYPVIAIPQPPRAPRRVLITVTIAAVAYLLADVTYTDIPGTGGTASGAYAHVTQWSHQR